MYKCTHSDMSKIIFFLYLYRDKPTVKQYCPLQTMLIDESVTTTT